MTFGDFEVYVLNTFLQVGGPLPMQGSLSDPVARPEEDVRSTSNSFEPLGLTRDLRYTDCCNMHICDI